MNTDPTLSRIGISRESVMNQLRCHSPQPKPPEPHDRNRTIWDKVMVNRVRRMHSQGYKLRAIAAETGVPLATVYGMVKGKK